ncbi:3-hydroxyacyl-CoA dehydrogenase NAD-binding domain-containing protein [Halobacteriovorax sp. JY17]|uniref:3-hydroxyacyl-CoA dehydrogenase NAD-binding domain-containing protein n=1 Tax=Halobacteriovorax sp. JY17 TaxID=2014617 RepID=UPI000C66665A|nr:3-hydroxyacyl-CoA dehydrogenase NAD-binding domain-containing protein [Halobacteriovorax sp. JY17]PIK15942.1 MAG: 3-hydroxybutyryl-CoA dehydrogenase [Halobacteriovorax sp. JY17]
MTLSSVLVVGAGTMGQGIAQWFAQQSVSVQLLDGNPDVAKSAISNIHQSWEKLQAKNKFSKEEVQTFKASIEAVDWDNIRADTTLVVEAIIENLDIKTDVFNKLDGICGKETIFASNTSSIPISSLAKTLPEFRREKFLGLHFFNPAPIMKLVEIIKGHWTREEIITDFDKWFTERKKEVAICNDSPGFIVNRVARNFYGESLRIVSSYNVDKMKEVDNVLKKCGGFKMGPFELMDLIGIDINYSVTESVWNSFYNEPRFAPHQLQKKMVDCGRLGRKTKGGFYDYE